MNLCIVSKVYLHYNFCLMLLSYNLFMTAIDFIDRFVDTGDLVDKQKQAKIVPFDDTRPHRRYR